MPTSRNDEIFSPTFKGLDKKLYLQCQKLILNLINIMLSFSSEVATVARMCAPRVRLECVSLFMHERGVNLASGTEGTERRIAD